MADADRLVAYARALTNKRVRKLRTELRAGLGDALNIGVKLRDSLDGLESDDLFVVFKPGASLAREDFADHAPLLRQAVVAACAAAETYLADWAINEFREVMRQRRELAPRALRIVMTVSEWQDIQSRKYQRREITDYVVGPYIREHASTAPSKVGEILSMVGHDKPLALLDGLRTVPKGTTDEELTRLTTRRNKIAHESDRLGRGRAAITVDEVKGHLAVLRSVVSAISSLSRTTPT
jgi:hypothetical protein